MKIVFFALFVNQISLAAVVDRLAPGDTVDRLGFIQKGLIGDLHTAEQRAQFRLLLCQPRAAWAEAEKISDPEMRELFEGTILALASTERPSAGGKAQRARREKMPVGEDVAAKFELDQKEVWADEVGDITVNTECNFPVAMKAAEVAAKAKEKLAKTLAIAGPNLPVFALATDVGLQPEIDETTLQAFGSGKSAPDYLPRMQFFAESKKQEDASDIKIKGVKAWTSTLSLADISLHPHRLRIPWLLQ